MIHLIIQSILLIIHYYFTRFLRLFCSCLSTDVHGGTEVQQLIPEEPDFVDIPYEKDGRLIEEPPFIADHKQEYLERDYRPIMFSRFPLFYVPTQMPKKWKMSHFQANKIIKNELLNGEDKYWTNQTLSYMRNRKSFKQIMDILIENNVPHDSVVDATANIGGDSISFACEGIKHIKSYEILSNVYEMLRRNISLFKFDDVITPVNARFDYDIDDGSLVIIDPPFEKGNNTANYNLSIDNMPICAVCDKLLYGDLPRGNAAYVLLTMPKEYKYNLAYARDHKQSVKAYRSEKNVKFFLVGKSE